MTDEDVNKLRGIVKEEINEAITPVSGELKAVSGELKAVSEELANLMVEVKGSVIPRLENLNKSVKNIETGLENDRDNTKRLDKRLASVEGKLGIQAPPELQLVK